MSQKEHKWITYKIIKIVDECVYFEITDQSHLDNKFGDCHSPVFISSNGFRLESADHPEMRMDRCFVWGRNTARNNNILSCPIIIFKKFKKAVEEYNTYNYIFII